MRQFTIAAAAVVVAGLLSAAPASADNIGGGPVKQNGQCWKASKGSGSDGTFGHWQACTEKASTPAGGQPGRRSRRT